MLQCKLCNYTPSKIFSNKAKKHNDDLNKRQKISLQTQLSMHILSIHNITIENYIVKTEYNGAAPICICGFCTDRPIFYRGTFKKYALNHDTFKFREDAYINKFGKPKCKNCNELVKFHRGDPREFCSLSCGVLNKKTGFCSDDVQKTIRKNNLKKYGTEFVSQLPEVRKKLSELLKGNGLGRVMSDEQKNKISIASKISCLKPGYRENICPKISEARKKNWQNETYRKTILTSLLHGGSSKLHMRIRDELKLESLGFISEQVIDRYVADEINYDTKIIIEVNGDYIHANPRMHVADDIITVGHREYTAKQKWDYDSKRKLALEALGYRVIIIWESDDLSEFKI